MVVDRKTSCGAEHDEPFWHLLRRGPDQAAIQDLPQVWVTVFLIGMIKSRQIAEERSAVRIFSGRAGHELSLVTVCFLSVTLCVMYIQLVHATSVAPIFGKPSLSCMTNGMQWHVPTQIVKCRPTPS